MLILPRFTRIYRFFLLMFMLVLPCIRLARGKFELTNQDSVGGKNSSVLSDVKLTSQERQWNQTTFLTREDIKYPRERIYNFKNQISWQRVKNMNHFVFLRFYFGTKNGSPALGMVNSHVLRRVSPGMIIVVLFWTKYAVSRQIKPGILIIISSSSSFYYWLKMHITVGLARG